jgi:hypothetical protein
MSIAVVLSWRVHAIACVVRSMQVVAQRCTPTAFVCSLPLTCLCYFKVNRKLRTLYLAV